MFSRSLAVLLASVASLTHFSTSNAFDWSTATLPDIDALSASAGGSSIRSCTRL